jgi:6-pyruvoyltetrahydropterin/6-carboxytetrahydropterin synthase
MRSSIFVRHNAEIAHRLSQLPGKCQRIHGHSIQIELSLFGKLNSNGILEGLDFGNVKKKFRGHIDDNFDHHLLLSVNDPLVQQWRSLYDQMIREHSDPVAQTVHWDEDGLLAVYPGAVLMPNDPTIENLSTWIASWASDEFKLSAHCKIQETNTNGAECLV